MKIEFTKSGWLLLMSHEDYSVVYGSFNEVISGFFLAEFEKKIGVTRDYLENLCNFVAEQRVGYKIGSEENPIDMQTVKLKAADLEYLANVFQETWNYFSKMAEAEMRLRLDCSHGQYLTMLNQLKAALGKEAK